MIQNFTIRPDRRDHGKAIIRSEDLSLTRLLGSIVTGYHAEVSETASRIRASEAESVAAKLVSHGWTRAA